MQYGCKFATVCDRKGYLKSGRLKLQLNGFWKNFKQHYIDTESENKKIWSDHIFNSACPCKKVWPEVLALYPGSGEGGGKAA